MKRGPITSLAWYAFFAASSSVAIAHSPYLERGETWIGPNGKNWQIAMLRGDGIVGPGPDPARPVVLDDAGLVVAQGPLVSYGIAYCSSETNCLVVTPDTVIEPDAASFRTPRKPDFYPEHETESFGFRPAKISVFDWIWICIFAWAMSPIMGLIFFLIFARLGARVATLGKTLLSETGGINWTIIWLLTVIPFVWWICGTIFMVPLLLMFVAGYIFRYLRPKAVHARSSPSP